MSGAAGWFEIVPATNYEGVYCDIRQAITLYYEIMDICKAEETYVEEYANASKGKKKKMKPPKSPSLDTLFLKVRVCISYSTRVKSNPLTFSMPLLSVTESSDMR